MSAVAGVDLLAGGGARVEDRDEPVGSFDAWFPDLFALAYRTAYRVLGDRGEAEDVAQEALARAASRWSRVRDDPRGWVAVVAGNRAVDVLRSRGRRAAREERAGGTDERGHPGADVDARLDLQRALARLPRRQREVLVLRYLADLRDDEVAAALGISPGGVKKHAARALAALRSAPTTALQEA